MRLGTFIIVKNEVEYIGYCIMSILPYISEMVFADGKSTDGTLELIKHIKREYDTGNKIHLYENRDCKDLKDDYVRLFNWTIKQCESDYIWFLHPDMIVTNPKAIEKLKLTDVKYSVNINSIAGEKRELLINIGRTKKWNTIYKNDYGIHYHGYYGSLDEDVYFKDFTGEDYTPNTIYTPYTIGDSKININHYCETKPYKRRYERMVKCLINQGHTEYDAKELGRNHPRVTLQSGVYMRNPFIFTKNHLKEPSVFRKYRKEFDKFRKI